MRVRGDNAPSNAFSLEEQPNKQGGSPGTLL